MYSLDLNGNEDLQEVEGTKLLRSRLESVNDVTPVMNLIREGIQAKVQYCCV